MRIPLGVCASDHTALGGAQGTDGGPLKGSEDANTAHTTQLTQFLVVLTLTLV